MATGPAGYWASAWPGEDGGPARRQAPHQGVGLGMLPGEQLAATMRVNVATAMVVHRDRGELYLLGHTLGTDTVAWVERIDPITLETLERSEDLPAGPFWPGGMAVHANGDLYVVQGRWAHRLDPSCATVRSVELPQPRPYNSFLIRPDGALVTKDFAKDGDDPSRLIALDPDDLSILGVEQVVPERSIARLSALGDDLYVVGTEHLWRYRIGVDGAPVRDESFAPRYVTGADQTYAWDAVLDDGAAWLLDQGEGTERFAMTFRGQGSGVGPLHLLRVGLDGDHPVTGTEVCADPGGIVANPPVVDPERRIAVGYDSGNGVLRAWRIGDGGALTELWEREQDHAAHCIRYPDTGELVTHDHDLEAQTDHVVVLAIESGEELGRVATGSPMQSVLFPAPGFGRDLYSVSFAGVARISVT